MTKLLFVTKVGGSFKPCSKRNPTTLPAHKILKCLIKNELEVANACCETCSPYVKSPRRSGHGKLWFVKMTALDEARAPQPPHELRDSLWTSAGTNPSHHTRTQNTIHIPQEQTSHRASSGDLPKGHCVEKYD